jgi:CubicO group peptidase (beta-lactamase class C family)
MPTLALAAALSSTLLLAAAPPVPPPVPPKVPPATGVPALDLAAACTQAADYSARFSGRVVLVMHQGRVVFERADNGWTADRPHPLASGTKSFVGPVAMRAVQDGLLTLDERAADTITEWQDDPRKSRITVRHLLTLSSGLDPADALLGGRGGGRLLGTGAEERDRRLGGPDRRQARDNFAESLLVPAIRDPGAAFDYGPSHFYAFAELLERKLRARAAADPGFTLDTFEKYMRSRLFDPISLRVFRIGKDAAGNPNLPGGAMLTAREWAKWGLLMLRQGSVAGPDGTSTQVVEWRLLRECFEPSTTNPTYGLTWWLPANGDAEASLIADGPGANAVRRARQRSQNRPTLGPDGKPLTMYMAAGLGKQRLYVIPAVDLVVVRFAEASREGRAFDDLAFLAPLLKAVPPAASTRE